MSDPFLEQVTAYLAAHGVESYLVGGYVRDLLLKRTSNDFDIAVSGDAVALARRMADALHGHFVLLDDENNIARVVAGDGHAYTDLSRLRGANLQTDLAARDVTINAMALPLPLTGLRALVDPFGGQRDIKDRLVRAVGETSLSDDPVRLVRAVRFAAQLGYQIEPQTAAAAWRHAHLLERVAAERVRDEFVRILAAAGAWRNLRLLDDLTLLTRILPELDALRNVGQPEQHAYDVFTHSLAVADAIEETLIACELTSIGERPAGPPHRALPSAVLGAVAERVRPHIAETVAADRTRMVTLKLGALLHDVGKPLTRSVGEDGDTHFYNHPLEGVALAEAAMLRLRFSTREMRIVSTMITHHMRPAQIASDPQVTRRAVYRYFRDTGAEGVDTLLLSLADHVGTRGPRLDPQEWWRHAQFTRLMLEHYYARPEQTASLPKLLSGSDIMKTFGLPAGRRVGLLLEAVREAQGAGEVTTRDEALGFVQRLLEEQKMERG